MKSDNDLACKHRENYERMLEMHKEWGWTRVAERAFYYSDTSERCRITLMEAPGSNIWVLIYPFELGEGGTCYTVHYDNKEKPLEIMGGLTEKEIFALIKAEIALGNVYHQVHEAINNIDN